MYMYVNMPLLHQYLISRKIFFFFKNDTEIYRSKLTDWAKFVSQFSHFPEVLKLV